MLQDADEVPSYEERIESLNRVHHGDCFRTCCKVLYRLLVQR